MAILIRGLVRRDGVWMESLRYSPYGVQIDSTGPGYTTRFKWTGQLYDAETGFSYHRARYYDPQAKRFTQEDPVGYAGGGNVYAYVGGAVLEARDPSGMIKEQAGGSYLDTFLCGALDCAEDSGYTVDGLSVSRGGAGGALALYAISHAGR